MAKGKFRKLGASLVVLASLAAVQAEAQQVRPGVTPGVGTAIAKTVNYGRVGAPSGSQENLVAGPGGIIAIIALIPAFLAVYIAVKNDSPSSR